MRRATVLFVVLASSLASAQAHDIPNARVDRSIQATLGPGGLELDYEVSLSELTLTQDLRNLIGSLPDGDRAEWFDRYGRETGPLNAKGFLVSVDGRPVALLTAGFDLKVEEHPRYTFHFRADLPRAGRLSIQDTNFVASEGTSRLAVRGRDGVVVRGDELAPDVERIAIRPVWQLSDAEERRTRQVEVDFESEATSIPAPAAAPRPPRPTAGVAAPGPRTLSRLLDRGSGLSLLAVALLAFGLGAAHAVQPGHGKTLVAAAVVSDGGSWIRGALLALTTTVTHTGSVLLVALGLWLTRSSQYATIHKSLAHCAGFAIAAIGLWRLGRQLAGYAEHETGAIADADPGSRNVIALGVAGGLVPCWDAVALIVLAEAIGRLRLGVALLVAFGLGMAVVLIAVGSIAARFRRYAARPRDDIRAERWLGIGGSVVLSLMGIYLLGIG